MVRYARCETPQPAWGSNRHGRAEYSERRTLGLEGAVTRSLETGCQPRGREAKTDAVCDNFMDVWVRTDVQFPPQRCTGDGSTLRQSLDTRLLGARQGCKTDRP